MSLNNIHTLTVKSSNSNSGIDFKSAKKMFKKKLQLIYNGEEKVWEAKKDTNKVEKNIFRFDTNRLIGRGGVKEIKEADIEQIIQEPQLHMSDFHFAYEKGGTLTRLALDHLKKFLAPDELTRLRIDTKVHVLEPHDISSIPGWHCDYVLRNQKGELEYNLDRDNEIRHFIVLSGPPATQWVKPSTEQVIKGQHINWGIVDKAMKKLPAGSTFTTPAGAMLEFSSNSLHRGVPYEVKDGEKHARFLFRASLFPEGDNVLKTQAKNKKRTHQQVYNILSKQEQEEQNKIPKPSLYKDNRKPDQILQIKESSNELIEKEPHMQGVSFEYAMKEGGAITKEILKKMIQKLKKDERRRLRIFVDVNMLNDNFYPELPGWKYKNDRHIEDASTAQYILQFNPPYSEYINKDGDSKTMESGILYKFGNNQLFHTTANNSPSHDFSWRYQFRAVLLGEDQEHNIKPTEQSSIQNRTFLSAGSWW